MAAVPGRLPNGFVVYVPPNGASVTQPGQVMPGTVLPFVLPCGGQQLGSPSDPVQSNPRQKELEQFLKTETKTLAAIQIIIGLMHIGFGSISFFLDSMNYRAFAVIGGYPFWGGVLFIASGSVTVSSQKNTNTNLEKCSLGFNTASAVAAFIGIILYLTELSLSSPVSRNSEIQSRGAAATGLGILLLMFTLLEFGITALLAHFGCQTFCCTNDIRIVYVPYTNNGEVTQNESVPSSSVCGTVEQSNLPFTTTGQVTRYECIPSAPVYEGVPQTTEA
uniref:Uncharacterized protein n=1 Tax=Salvator merianae TaxID=96440 RepID=A0A8D0B3K7_SALMN